MLPKALWEGERAREPILRSAARPGLQHAAKAQYRAIPPDPSNCRRNARCLPRVSRNARSAGRESYAVEAATERSIWAACKAD
jgi:hypothetical protein